MVILLWMDCPGPCPALTGVVLFYGPPHPLFYAVPMRFAKHQISVIGRGFQKNSDLSTTVTPATSFSAIAAIFLAMLSKSSSPPCPAPAFGCDLNEA